MMGLLVRRLRRAVAVGASACHTPALGLCMQGGSSLARGHPQTVATADITRASTHHSALSGHAPTSQPTHLQLRLSHTHIHLQTDAGLQAPALSPTCSCASRGSSSSKRTSGGGGSGSTGHAAGDCGAGGGRRQSGRRSSGRRGIGIRQQAAGMSCSVPAMCLRSGLGLLLAAPGGRKSLGHGCGPPRQQLHSAQAVAAGLCACTCDGCWLHSSAQQACMRLGCVAAHAAVCAMRSSSTAPGGTRTGCTAQCCCRCGCMSAALAAARRPFY